MCSATHFKTANAYKDLNKYMNLKSLLSLFPEAVCGSRRAEYFKFFDQCWSGVRNPNWWEPKRLVFDQRNLKTTKRTPAWVLRWDYGKWETKKIQASGFNAHEISSFSIPPSLPMGKLFIALRYGPNVYIKKKICETWHSFFFYQQKFSLIVGTDEKKKTQEASKWVKKTVFMPASLFDVW